MDSDILLIQRMRAGEEQAIDLFVRKYYAKVLKYCRFHIGDYGYAEDMTQETFEHFFRTFNSYQHYGKAVNYLYVIAANTCRDYHRKTKEITMENLPEQPDLRMDKLEERMDVHSAIDKLPQELKEVAILYFFQDIKQKEIARILEIGLPLVKYRVRKAKEMLNGYLEKEVANEPAGQKIQKLD